MMTHASIEPIEALESKCRTLNYRVIAHLRFCALFCTSFLLFHRTLLSVDLLEEVHKQWLHELATFKTAKLQLQELSIHRTQSVISLPDHATIARLLELGVKKAEKASNLSRTLCDEIAATIISEDGTGSIASSWRTLDVVTDGVRYYESANGGEKFGTTKLIRGLDYEMNFSSIGIGLNYPTARVSTAFSQLAQVNVKRLLARPIWAFDEKFGHLNRVVAEPRSFESKRLQLNLSPDYPFASHYKVTAEGGQIEEVWYVGHYDSPQSTLAVPLMTLRLLSAPRNGSPVFSRVSISLLDNIEVNTEVGEDQFNLTVPPKTVVQTPTGVTDQTLEPRDLREWTEQIDAQ